MNIDIKFILDQTKLLKLPVSIGLYHLCIFTLKVVSNYINTIKTTFHLNFYSHQAVKQHEYT